MSEKKPQNITEYKRWLFEKYKAKIDIPVKNHYESVALRVRDSFITSPLWQKILSELNNLKETYYLSTHYDLLSTLTTDYRFATKPFDSFLLKTFRTNILENSLWPNEPEGGWLQPENWISRANDIVRTCITVKYLDGVEFLLKKLHETAEQDGAESWKYYVGGVDGYYAGHLYVRREYEVPKLNFNTEYIPVTVELQITTQIHEVIRRLLHKHFEQRRKKTPTRPEEWQWDYRSEEFATNYLGHLLHYIDGMIMDLRERKREDN